jgi:hypothetical protein
MRRLKSIGVRGIKLEPERRKVPDVEGLSLNPPSSEGRLERHPVVPDVGERREKVVVGDQDLRKPEGSSSVSTSTGFPRTRGDRGGLVVGRTGTLSCLGSSRPARRRGTAR